MWSHVLSNTCKPQTLLSVMLFTLPALCFRVFRLPWSSSIYKYTAYPIANDALRRAAARYGAVKWRRDGTDPKCDNCLSRHTWGGRCVIADTIGSGYSDLGVCNCLLLTYINIVLSTSVSLCSTRQTQTATLFQLRHKVSPSCGWDVVACYFILFWGHCTASVAVPWWCSAFLVANRFFLWLLLDQYGSFSHLVDSRTSLWPVMVRMSVSKTQTLLYTDLTCFWGIDNLYLLFCFLFIYFRKMTCCQ